MSHFVNAGVECFIVSVHGLPVLFLVKTFGGYESKPLENLTLHGSLSLMLINSQICLGAIP